MPSTAIEIEPTIPAPGTDNLVSDIAGVLEQGQFQWGITSATGVVFKDETPKEYWETHTRNVAILFEATGKQHSTAAMILGDCLNFGEEKFGEEFADVINASREFMRVSMKTIINWSYIAGKIPPSRRRENLSLSHHEAVCKLPADEQAEYLMLADNEGLSVTELKAKIKEAHPGKPRAPKAKVTVHVEETPEAMLDAATRVCNWLKANEETAITEEFEPILADIHKLYRRRYQNGHAKKQKDAAQE